MKRYGIVFLAVVTLLTGCIQIPKRIDVNLNTDGEQKDVPPSSVSSSGGEQAPESSAAPRTAGERTWREIATDLAGQVFLAAENGVLFYAFDTLAYPKSPVDLVARVQSVDNMKSVEGASVSFYKGDELIGAAKTDEKGLAKLTWTPPAAENYELKAVITGAPKGAPEKILQVSAAPLLVCARPKDTRFVVIDLDHTVVESSFFRVLIGGASPMANSVEVTNRIAGVYSIIYLTHRPDLLTRKSKQWLSQHGYPRGPVLVSELEQAFGDSGKFKTAKLKALRKSYSKVAIGIGDKPSDAQAYVDNGLTAYLVPHYKEKPKGMRKMVREIRRLNARGRLNVVDGWREIEAGIFRGRKFGPSKFADRLQRRAKQMEKRQEEERRKKKDDDDDEDDDDDD